METAAIRFFDIVLFAHVASVVVAFGPTFAYPFLQVLAERRHPRSVPYVMRAMARIDLALITPGAILVLLAGIYLVVDGPFDWSDAFVSVGLAAIVAILGLMHGFLRPHERRLAELAERDVATSGEGEVRLSDEYWAVSKRYGAVGSVTSLLVLVALFFMVVKP